MTWILIAYLLVLLYVAANREKFPTRGPLRTAWLCFAAIPASEFLFALFRAGNVGSARDLALVEIWSNGIAWLLLGISIYFLTGTVAPERPSYPSDLPPPPQ